MTASIDHSKHFLEPLSVSPSTIDGAIMRAAHIINISETCGPPSRRLKILERCESELERIDTLCESAFNSADLYEQKLGLRILFGKIFMHRSIIYFNRQHIGDQGKNLSKSIQNLEKAEAAFEAGLRLNSAHVKTMIRLLRANVIHAQLAPAEAKDGFLDAAYDLLDRAYRTYGKQPISPKLHCVAAELYLGEAYLFPELAAGAYDKTRIAFSQATKASRRTGADIALICQSYFNQPTLPDKNIALIKLGASPSGMN